MEGHGTIMRKHHILTAVAAAAVFSLGASTLALAGEESTSGGTFTYARSDSTTSFDLHQEITENNAFAIDKVFESLVTFDNDGNIIDWLAEDHKISDDGLVYTFTLRDGLKFSDGTDVTDAFIRGAQETLRLACDYNCRYAIFKERSPSCGAGVIYDGNFNHTRVVGDGVTTQLLRANGIIVLGESQIGALLHK